MYPNDANSMGNIVDPDQTDSLVSYLFDQLYLFSGCCLFDMYTGSLILTSDKSTW